MSTKSLYRVGIYPRRWDTHQGQVIFYRHHRLSASYALNGQRLAMLKRVLGAVTPTFATGEQIIYGEMPPTLGEPA